MSIDKETARRAAHLARIAVPEEELENLADAVTDGDQIKKILKNAPDSREGFFAVPKVME